MSTAVENQRKLLVAAGIVIAMLMIVVAVLLFNKAEKNQVIDEQKTEIDETKRLNDELQAEYENAIAELDEAVAENEELRSMVEEQKSELTKQKSRISKMINSGAANKGVVDAARKEIQELRSQQQAFIAKIDQLEEEKQMMGEEIVRTRREKDTLERVMTEEIRNVTAEKEAITAEKEVIEGEKVALEEEKEYLASKVDIGSVVKVQSVLAEGFKLKSGGKMVKKRYAKNVDVLKICYGATENRVTDAGTEQFLVRIITPLGTTMFVESLGSGTFSNKDTSEEMRFTKAQELPYDNKAVNQCMNWKPDTPFAKGTYKVEIFNKGYLAGVGEFRLK